MMKMNDKMFQDIIDDPTISTEEKIRMILEDNWKENFNLTGKKSPTSIGGAMNCPIVF